MVALLEDLVVDARELDRELVGTLLRPYLRIDRATCEIIPLEPWDNAPNEVRVLLYLLARRAMRALDLALDRAEASPVEIERATGIPGGSVRPALKRLLKARVVAKQDRIGYIVPNYAMSRVRDYIRPWMPSLVA
jgi:DNA-binding transcriptional ArsR family regulator